MYSEAILPAAECLFGKKKVTPAEIATEFRGSTLYVFAQDNKRKFVNDCQIQSDDKIEAQIGQIRRQHHDQRRTSYGDWRIVGAVTMERDGTFRHFGEEDHRLSNLPFAVYK